MFNTRNKAGISAHPCIILYIFPCAMKDQTLNNLDENKIINNMPPRINLIYGKPVCTLFSEYVDFCILKSSNVSGNIILTEPTARSAVPSVNPGRGN